ncbi:LysE family translocator [Thalassococcus profundi]|uniref:LysE family translocator n=1 Tax=Thalassococcus profundi TaxID=2282382 RepID=A0A369TNQ0_9RHOB|nr:LysE family transporter [Thalassococcus profundi]RDD66888.1 LysE family translocator [Thalassococcus profundi]
MTLGAFLTVALIHLAAAMSPGPSFVVAARTAATDGFGTACALSLGFGLGAALWALAAMAGLALLFELVPALFAVLKIVGGLFLIWIAWTLWRHATSPLPDTATRGPRSALSAMRFGFLTFATNPKTAVFFGAVFVGLVPADTPLALRAALIVVIFANEVLWYIAVAFAFSRPRARALYLRAKAWLDRAFGLLIAGFGLRIALT